MAEKFIKMTKEGETIEVSPLVVEDHKSLGWKVVEEPAAAAREVKARATKAEETKKQTSK